jgi:iron complex outermembrane receptor protein
MLVKANPRVAHFAINLSMALCGISVSAMAQAQTQGASAVAGTDETAATGITEIVVTAQKRSQSSQDVGITMSAISADNLADANVTSVTDIVGLVPGVQANYGAGQVAFNVRGIGTNDFAGNLDSPVAVNVDEVYQSKTFMTGLLLFDIDRVELLKGPQGTLFGRNATGGTVNFYTRRPSETFGVGLTSSYDNYETIRTEAYVTGPITTNLSARISGMFVNQGKGYYRNLTRIDRDGAEKKWAVRGQLQFDDGNTSALLTVGAGEQNGTLQPYEGVGVFTPTSLAAGSPVLCAAYLAGRATGGDPNCVRGTDGRNPGDNNPFTSNNNTPHRVANKSFDAKLRIEQDLGFGTLTSLTGYQYFWRRQNEDADGSPVDTIDLFYNEKIKQFTQELRISSAAKSRWNYVAGLYFEKDWYNNGDYAETARGAAPGLYSPFTQNTTAFAVFANSDYAVTDNLSLVQGVRYSEERIRFEGGTYLAQGATGTPPRPTTIIATLSFADTERSDNATTFKSGVEWRPNLNSNFVDKLLVYGNVSTGFRSGGYSATFATVQSSLTSLAPEKITAYELGFKSTLSDRKLQVNAAVFRYQFTDGYINVDVPNSLVPITVNAAKISSYGVEADVQWRPVQSLELGFGGSWLDSKLGGDISQNGQSLSGKQTVQSPSWTIAARGRYTQPISDSLQGVLALNSSYRSAQFFETNNSANSKEPGYWLVDANLKIESNDGRWSLGAFVKNLTKTNYRTYVNDLPGFGFIINVYGNPRVFGLSGSVAF